MRGCGSRGAGEICGGLEEGNFRCAMRASLWPAAAWDARESHPAIPPRRSPLLAQTLPAIQCRSRWRAAYPPTQICLGRYV